MSASSLPELPGLSWTEDATVATPKGGKLRRYGLVKVGSIRAYKLRPHRPNSHLRQDTIRLKPALRLLSCVLGLAVLRLRGYPAHFGGLVIRSGHERCCPL